MGNNTNKEIADIAPNLAAMKKQNPFLVPDGYFSSLENRVLDSLDKKPSLAHTTPDGYFDNLSDRVLERVQVENDTRVVPFYKKRWLSIAASFIILLGAGYLLTTPSDASIESTEFVFDIDPAEALEYLEENDNLYLTDLLSLEIYEDDYMEEETEMEDWDNVDIDELLEELDTEDLEELL